MTIPTKLLRPASPDLIVRGLDRHVLPPEGAERAYTAFWRRRVLDGDVLASDPEPAPETEPTQE